MTRIGHPGRSYVALAVLVGVIFGGAYVLESVEPKAGQGGGAQAGAPAAAAAEPGAEATKEPESIDVTAKVREMNSDKFAAPPTEFRKGHVTARELEASAITKIDKGFAVQLPSKAPVPTPTVYRGKVYVSGGFHSKEFYCFDAKTGRFVWGRNLDDDGPSSAVCEDGVTVFNTESCTIFALDAETGDQLWSLWLGDPLTSTPTIAGGRVFTSYPAGGGGGVQAALQNAVPQNAAVPAAAPPVAAQQVAKPKPEASHVLACLELKTGKILWQRWLDSDVMSAAVAIDDELYVTSFGGTVYKFKQADGAIVSATKSRATSAPVVVGNQVYLTSRADKGSGDAPSEQITSVGRADNRPTFETAKKDAKYLDAKVQVGSVQGALAMKLDAANGFASGAPSAANAMASLSNVGQSNVSTMQAFQGSRLVHMGGWNYNCMGDEIVCTSAADGKQAWNVKLSGDLAKDGGFLGAAPAAVAGHLVLASLSGDVLCLDAKTGKAAEKYSVGSAVRAQPAVEGGWIYVGTQDGKLVAIDTGKPAFTGWSTWGGNSAHTGIVAK
jgi:outer membrane protein assembly factor BamB